MEDQLKELNISKKSYAFVFLVLIAFVVNGAASEYLMQSVKHYAIFNAGFYALMCVMIYSVFSDIINSPKEMSSRLRKKLKTRLYAVIFVLMPLIAFVDMKATIIQNNWII